MKSKLSFITALTITLILAGQTVFAQKTFTALIDGSNPVGNYYDGFSYNATFEIRLVKRTQRTSTSEAGDEDRDYSVKLISLQPAAGGFYHKGKKKSYDCSQLGSFCNPMDFREIQGKISFACSGISSAMNFNFSSIGQQLELHLYVHGNCKDDIYGFAVNEVFSVINNYNQYVSRIYEIENPKPNSSNTNIGVNSTTSNTTMPNDPLQDSNKQNVQNTTSKQSINTNDLNPITNGSSGYYQTQSTSNDKFTQNVQMATSVINTAAPLIEQWNKKREEKWAKEEEVRKKNEEEKKRIELEENKIKQQTYQKKFIEEYYNKYYEDAINGNENARLILYYQSYHLWSTSLLPERLQWHNEMILNKNPDVLLEATLSGQMKIENKLKILERLANLGNLDAMVMLGNYYNDILDFSDKPQGNDAAKALYWYNLAAQNGCPKANFFLGRIYKYGYNSIFGCNKDMKKTSLKYHVKYDIERNDKKALEYFNLALNPTYIPSVFSREHYEKLYSYLGGSTFVPETYNELANYLEDGKFINQDINLAGQFRESFKGYLPPIW